MAKKLYEESNISAIASAIRSKNGLSSTYTTSDMASAILSIKTDPVLESLNISANGSYTPGTGVDGFSEVVVNVSGSAPVLESLNVSSNGSYSPGTGVDGFSNVVVSVPGSAAVLASKTISQNGTYIALDDSCDGYDQVVVSVPSGGGGDDSLIKAIEGHTSPLIVSNSALSAIRDYGFYNHRGITEIYFENVLDVGYSAFYSCSNVSIISLPNCVEIKGYAFAGSCNNIRSISLDKLTSIGSNVFLSCAGINYVSAPLLSTIEMSAFLNCKNISEIYIPSCTFIGTSAFGNCSKITSIWLPICSQIGSYGFANCTMLESIYLLSVSVVKIYSRTFYHTPLDDSSYLGHFGSVFVPESLVDTYKSQNYWSNISDRITAYIE